MSANPAIQNLIHMAFGADPEEGQSIADSWRERFGGDLPEELQFLDAIPTSDAIDTLLQSGASAASAAALAASVAATLGVAAAPVVGWCVAVGVLVSNMFTLGKASGSQLEAARDHNAALVESVRSICTLIQRPPPPDKTGPDDLDIIQTYPDWTGAGQYPAAWWWLRSLEIVSVVAGSYLESGRAAHYRHALLADIRAGDIGRASYADLREGWPSVNMLPASDGRLELASGSKQRLRGYARGVAHCQSPLNLRLGIVSAIKPVIQMFTGENRTVNRRMAAHSAAARSILAALKLLPTTQQRQGFMAALVLGSQAAFLDRDSVDFVRGAPDPLEKWQGWLEGTATGDVLGWTLAVTVDPIPSVSAACVSAVRSKAPRRVFAARTSRPLVSEPARMVGATACRSDLVTPFAVFAATRRGRIPVTGESLPGPVVLVDYVVPTASGIHVRIDAGLSEALAGARGVEPYPDFFKTVLPDDHPGMVWLRAVILGLEVPGLTFSGGTVNGPVQPLYSAIAEAMERFKRAGVVIDLDRGGPDRADTGGSPIGLGGLALGALAVWAATRS